MILTEKPIGVAVSALTLTLMCASANADDAMIVHEAHEHGTALLTLIQEDSELAIELNSPAMNITGFEHFAGTDEQKKAVSEAIVLLEGGDALFTLIGGECVLTSSSTDFGALTSEDAHHGHGHEEHGHEEHGHEEHGHEEHGHEEHDHKPSEHADITALFEYQCEHGDRLSAIDVKLFDLFAGIHRLDAVWIVGEQSGKQLLTENSGTLITLRQ